MKNSKLETHQKMKERSVKSEYELVKEILKRNPEYLDKYIKENVSNTQLRKIMKSKDDEKTKTSQELSC